MTDPREDTAQIADAATAMVAVADEGLRGAQTGLGRIADADERVAVAQERTANSLDVLPEVVGRAIGEAAGAAVREVMLPFSQSIAAIEGKAGKDGVGLQGIQGPQGIQGIKGETGTAGTNGTAGGNGTNGALGLQGVQGLQGDKGLNWRGAWDGRRAYEPDDAVERDGSSFVATASIRRLGPPGNGWDLLAQRGAPGPALSSGGSSAPTIYDDGVRVGSGRSISFDGGDPITSSGGIIHVPVGGAGGSDDQTAAEVPFTPAGPITATNTQEAVEQAAALGGGAAYGDGPPDGDVHAWYYRNDELGTFYVNLGTLVTPDWQPIAALTNASSDAGLQVSVSNVVSLFGAALEVNAGPDPVGADYLSGEDDPSAGAGVAAPVPAIYLRKAPGVVGELWLKTGGADTDWTQLGSGGGTPAADPGAPPAAIADPTLATAEDVALAYNDLQAWADDLRNAMLAAGSLA